VTWAAGAATLAAAIVSRRATAASAHARDDAAGRSGSVPAPSVVPLSAAERTADTAPAGAAAGSGAAAEAGGADWAEMLGGDTSGVATAEASGSGSAAGAVTETAAWRSVDDVETEGIRATLAREGGAPVGDAPSEVEGS